jgi:hypothetical protein
MKTRFTTIATLLVAVLGTISPSASAADPQLHSVAGLNANRSALAGQTIRAAGKVVKVNNGIMGRNFVHVQDGSGDAASGSNNLIVTSKQTARVGDQVSIAGTVVVDRDFGSGYLYPLLIEEASITPKP